MVDPSFIHRRLPDSGVWKAKFEAEFYRLLPRKRQMYEGNYEMKAGLRYLIFSRYARVYYERRLNPLQETEENIIYYVKHGLLYLWPNEEDQEEIRLDTQNEKLSYWKLMYRRQTELDFDRREKMGRTGDGDQWWHKHRREEINKLKIKYGKR